MTAPIFTRPAEPFVNGLRLLRVVRLRREFRTLWHLSLLGVPVWIGLIVWVQAVTSSDSALWNLADEYATPGSLVLGALIVIGLLGMVVTRVVAGVPGRVAAAFVPIAVRGREATVAGDADAMSGLLPRLRRQQFVSTGMVVLFLVFATTGVAVAMNLGPVYAANHGRGGPVVTIGRDATVSGSRVSGHSRNYYLSTPDGAVLAEDSEPVSGQRWLIYHNPYGDDEAYLVGGHDYLLLGAILVLVAIGDAGILVVMARTVRRERRLREAGGHQPLAYSVRKLAAGARPVLSFGVARSVVIGLPPLIEDSDAAARAVLRRRRWHAAIAIGVVVVGAVGAGVLIQRVTQPPPPTTKDLTLGYLGSAAWSPDVEAFYTDTDAVHDVTVDMLLAGGVPGKPAVGPVWSVVVLSRSGNGDTGDVDVVGIGAASGQRAVAGGVAFEKEVADTGAPAPAAIAGLPPGWAGVSTDGKAGRTERTASVFGADGGTLVVISLTGTDTGTATDTDLADRARLLATAIAHRGITTFAADTAR